MLKQPWVEGYYAEAARTGEHLFFVLQPYVLKYTALPEKKNYVIMRGSRISSNNITALGGRAALIDMTLLREKMDAELERPKPDRRSRPSREPPMSQPTTSTDDEEALAERIEAGSLRVRGCAYEEHRDG